jgi:hypothetical protein
LRWLRRRQDARRLVQADRRGDHGAEAYSKAPQRAHEATSDAMVKHWRRVVLAIARKTGKRVGVDTATRMLGRHRLTRAGLIPRSRATAEDRVMPPPAAEANRRPFFILPSNPTCNPKGARGVLLTAPAGRGRHRGCSLGVSRLTAIGGPDLDLRPGRLSGGAMDTAFTRSEQGPVLDFAPIGPTPGGRRMPSPCACSTWTSARFIRRAGARGRG